MITTTMSNSLTHHSDMFTGRHWYALTTGLLLIYYPFGNDCLHALVSSTLVYAIMLLFPHYCGTLSWLVAFPYLIANHIGQASGLSWKEGNLDFTGAQMVLTLKLVAVAMCYQDGKRGGEVELREYAKTKKLDRLLSPLEYYSYLFATGNLLSGPFFEARDYLDFIENKGVWSQQDGERTVPQRPPWGAGLYRFVKALVCAAVWMYGSRLGFTVEFVESRKWQEDLPLLWRILSLWATVVIYRFKYYFVWGVAEAALILSGFGFNGYDEGNRPRWDRYINSRIRKVELNPSLADTPRHWNICTGLWLRHYVYERLTPINKKPSFVNMVITQLVSGIWHGVFAGYWLFFLSTAFMFQASRTIYRYEQSWRSAYRDFLPWVLIKVIGTALVLNYGGAAFIVLSFAETLQVWRAVYFFGHIVVFSLLLMGIVLPPKTRRKAPQIEAAAEGFTMGPVENAKMD